MPASEIEREMTRDFDPYLEEIMQTARWLARDETLTLGEIRAQLEMIGDLADNARVEYRRLHPSV